MIGFAAVTQLAREAGFAIEPFGIQVDQWVGRKFTRDGREVVVVGGLDSDLVAGGTVRINGGAATLVEAGDVVSALA